MAADRLAVPLMPLLRIENLRRRSPTASIHSASPYSADTSTGSSMCESPETSTHASSHANRKVRKPSRRATKQSPNNHRDRQLSPQDYVKSIAAHSRRSISSCIYAGQAYINFASWLQLSQASYEDNHCLAVLYDFALEGSERMRPLRGNELHVLDSHPRSSQDLGQVLLLRGCPSAEWISTIGGKYQIDPEFFHRHLNFFVTLVPRSVLALPSLPSTSVNIHKVCVTTISYLEKPKTNGAPEDLQARRIMEEESMEMYRRQYQVHARCGDSIVREFATLDAEFSLVEQIISFCIVKNGEGWLALVWLDAGRDIGKGSSGPWTKSQCNSGRVYESFPITQHHPKMSIRQTATEKALLTEQSHPMKDYESRTTILQSTALLPFELETFLDDESVGQNAFYALSNIFRHSAFSEVQVLNLLERQIQLEMGVLQLEEHKNNTLNNLQYFKSILTRHIRYIKDTLHTLKNVCDPFSDGGDEVTTTTMNELLIADFEDLLSRALELCERCTEEMGIMMNRAVIVESRKAIEQSERLKKLTVLASFYVPLTFSTSVFGMNFKEFGQGNLSAWLFAVVAIPVLVLTYCLYRWNIYSACKKALKWCHKLMAGRRSSRMNKQASQIT